MDCNQCVCSLCCRYARDITHREKIRNGEVTCCDYYPRPDNSLEKAIKAVSEMDISSGVSQSVYVIEECSELIKELMKKQRGKGSEKDILAEACDVLTTTFVLLTQYGVSRDYVKIKFSTNATEHSNVITKMEKFKEIL